MTLDGIPVGTLRSNLNSANVNGDDWCRSMGSHRYTTDKDGEKWCRDCLKTEKEINGEEKRN